MMRWRGVLGGLLVMLVACTGGNDSPGPQAAPIDTSPPGTELADGFVVPEGAALLGPVIPGAVLTYGGSADAPGWTALLDVDDDPLVALEDLVRQGEAQGLSALVTAGCAAVGDVRPECTTCETSGGFFRCWAILGGDGREVRIHTVRSLDPPADHVLVQSFPGGLVATDHIWEPSVVDPVPEDPPAPEPPEVGDELVGEFRFVEGSTLVGPAVGSADYALVRIDDPDAEQGYLDQVLAGSEELQDVVTVDHGDVRLRSIVGWVGAGGGDVATIAISTDGKPTYMLLMRMED
jgi:hypothetical protein